MDETEITVAPPADPSTRPSAPSLADVRPNGADNVTIAPPENATIAPPENTTIAPPSTDSSSAASDSSSGADESLSPPAPELTVGQPVTFSYTDSVGTTTQFGQVIDLDGEGHAQVAWFTGAAVLEVSQLQEL